LRIESETSPPSLKFQEVTLPNMPLRYQVELVSPQGWTDWLQNGSGVQQLPALLILSCAQSWLATPILLAGGQFM